MRRFVVLIALLTPLATAAAAPAQAPLPSVPACALGGGGRELRAFYEAELARAERRFGGSGAQRRAFSAAVAAYVYGPPPVAVRQTVLRFPENQLVSIGTLVDPAVRTVVFPNVDTTYTIGRLNLAAGPLVIDVPDTAGRYYVIQLLDAYSNTLSYIGRRTTGTRPGSYALVPRGYPDPLPPASGGSRAPRTTRRSASPSPRARLRPPTPARCGRSPPRGWGRGACRTPSRSRSSRPPRGPAIASYAAPRRARTDAARANWLPAPPGRFRLGMRLYEPRRSVLRGEGRPPPGRKLEIAPGGPRARARLRR